MHMVIRSADGQRLHPVLPGDPGNIGPKPFSNIRRDGIAAILCAKYAMDQRACVCVRHSSLSASSQPSLRDYLH